MVRVRRLGFWETPFYEFLGGRSVNFFKKVKKKKVQRDFWSLYDELGCM